MNSKIEPGKQGNQQSLSVWPFPTFETQRCGRLREFGWKFCVTDVNADTDDDMQWLAQKIVNLRVFGDENGLMNKALSDINGDILLISQFTLFAQTKKGNRPSYIRASKPDVAIPLYESMIGQLERDLGKKIFTGVFGADMQVDILNDGPVTILIDTKERA